MSKKDKKSKVVPTTQPTKPKQDKGKTQGTEKSKK